jgi:tetratricopeptide (TPR) repeat protein
MKITSGLIAILLASFTLPRATTAQQASAALDDSAKRAEAYFDFTLGHYYQVEYEIGSRSEDANRSIDFYKKAYTLDPDSQQIGEQLAEMYFQSQRIRDAVLEAQSIINKDSNNLSARRLLARIYVRTLGDLSQAAAQRDTVTRATDQYREILRLDPTDDDAALWLARLYRVQNAQDKAESVLRTLLTREPENENAVEQLTQLLLETGKSQEAISSLQGILLRSPTAGLYDLLGDAYTQVHDLTNAEMAYAKAIESQPGEIGHRKEFAQTLLNEGKFPEALDQYQRLAVMDSEDAENYLRQAEIYLQLKRLDLAEQNVLLAKQRSPGNLEVVYYESSIYQNEGRFEDAIHVLSDAVASVKTQAQYTPSRRRTLAILYQQLGQLYRSASNYAAAVNTFEEMIRLGPEEDRRARAMIIDTYRGARDMPKALEAAHKALEAYPSDRALRITQDSLFGDNLQTDQATADLRKLLDGTPADFEIQFELAQVYEQGKRWADAEQSVREAEKLARQPADKEATTFLLGAIFDRQKKYDQAEQAFQEVIKQNPQNAMALNYYGYMLADRGVRLEEATQLIQRALAEDPGNAAYEDSLGWAYFKQNKLAEAEDALRKAVGNDGRDPTMFSHLGDVYAKDGKDDLAEGQWQKSLDEWHRVIPAEAQPEKIAEVEQKISALKRRLAQRKTPAVAKP